MEISLIKNKNKGETIRQELIFAFEGGVVKAQFFSRDDTICISANLRAMANYIERITDKPAIKQVEG